VGQSDVPGSDSYLCCWYSHRIPCRETDQIIFIKLKMQCEHIGQFIGVCPFCIRIKMIEKQEDRTLTKRERVVGLTTFIAIVSAVLLLGAGFGLLVMILFN